MRRRNCKARLFRALTDETQKGLARRTGVHSVLIAQYELDKVEPSSNHLELLAAAAGLTVAAGDQILDFADALRRQRQRGGRGPDGLLADLGPVVTRVYQRLLRLPLPCPLPRPADRQPAGGLWARLEALSEDQQVAVVRVACDFQVWPLVERACAESVVQASRDLGRAASLARLAREIAEQVRGPQGWRDRVKGYAAGHGPNVQRVAGELKAARAGMEEAKRLWLAGSDPAGLLDPGRLLDLEASLCRAERRFYDALRLLNEARPVSRCPGHILINKAFTLDVMGDYERAIETLQEAELQPDCQADPRLANILHLNLAVALTHVSRFAEADALAQQVRERAAAMGDEIGLLRVTWVQGRIAAGLGRFEEARKLLEHARREFAARKMGYDVALALLEEAVLLLAEGRTAEVKALARDLAEVFDEKGVHREALAALRLFQEAAERDAATAELARQVLGFLFRARHDQGLRFTPA
jgi:tetratricopeptide (TPR) repeat protein/transcriptional regulator with XRE-family HTH domain